MGIINNIRSVFKKKELRSVIKTYYNDNLSYFAYNYAQNIYNIPEVRTAIESFADIFSTIPRYHKRVDKNGNITVLKDNINSILTLKPNPAQNASQFWKETITRLMLESNVFIEPIFEAETGILKKVYTLPAKVFTINYLTSESPMVTFYDAITGVQNIKSLNNLIYLNRFSALSGGQKNDLGLYETVIQALMQQAIEVANPKKPRAIMQGKIGQTSNIKEKDKKGEMQEVSANFANNVNGIVYFGNQWDVTPINWNEADVNRDLANFVVNIVYNYFGINDNIINGKASEVEYQLFIKNHIEPLARQIEEEFTAKLFTQREIFVGNKIEFDTFRLSVSTLQAKTALFSVASRQGVMNLDEMREMIGLAPIPDGYGKMFRVTADTISIDKVDEYQAAQKGVETEKEVEEDED